VIFVSIFNKIENNNETYFFFMYIQYLFFHFEFKKNNSIFHKLFLFLPRQNMRLHCLLITKLD